MMRFVALLAISILNFCWPAGATELTISQPGMYLLGDAITSSPAGADNIINITSSDVVLDLGGYVISQANATANVAGIVVNPSLNDIVIRNGTIRNVTGTGIVLTSTDARIRISNILFENCASAGMTADGSAGSINDIELTQCRFYGCSSTGTNVILWNNVNRSSIANCIIDGTSNTSLLTCLNVRNCTASSFIDITIQNNSSSGDFIGVDENICASNYFSNVINRNNRNTGNNFGFSTRSTASIYNNCLVIQNSATNILRSFNISGSLSTIFRQCQAVNSGGASNVTGFREDGLISVQSNIYLDSLVNTLTSPNSVEGFQLNGTGCIVGRCVASNNSGVSASGATGLNARRCIIFDSILSRNIGSGGTTGFGVTDSVPTTGDLYYRNVAFNNNVAQFTPALGFPQTIPASPATQFLNGITQPWTNLAVAT
ncbi:MAG TPA: hypothetical protein VHO47_00470 [Candidatus Babeliales bacterium]|nr:hypothetical protein [Candidatus Babeliales bacterium]